MKTSNSTFCEKYQNMGSSFWIMYGCLILFVLLLMTASIFGQSNQGKQIGVGLYSQVSADGYGLTNLPTVYIRNKQEVLFAGIALQKCLHTPSGIKIGYSYTVNNPYDQYGFARTSEFYFYADLGYNLRAKMGDATLRDEYTADAQAAEINVSSLRFNSVEGYAGFGVRRIFLKHFSWDTSLGFGGYYSLDFPDKFRLYYSQASLGLQLRTGITYTLSR